MSGQSLTPSRDEIPLSFGAIINGSMIAIDDPHFLHLLDAVVVTQAVRAKTGKIPNFYMVLMSPSVHRFQFFIRQ